MGTTASVNQAELHAIRVCAEKILEEGGEARQVRIFSDSQASLLALAADDTRSLTTLRCHEALQRLTEEYRVELHWVPGHMGVPGNENADSLAKVGTLLEWYGPEPALPVPWSMVRNKIKACVMDKSIRRFHEALGYRESKLYIRRQSKCDLAVLLSLSRAELRGVIAILTGHSNLRLHLKRMGLVRDDICRKCNSKPETSNHLLAECPAYWKQRMDCFERPILAAREWISKSYRILAKFITSTGGFKELSN